MEITFSRSLQMEVSISLIVIKNYYKINFTDKLLFAKIFLNEKKLL